MHVLLRLLINAAALWVATRLVPGISYTGDAVSLFGVALVFGVLNAIVRPILKLLTCPLIMLTLGLFTLVINAFLFWLTSVIGQTFGIVMVISDPVWWNAFLGGLVVSVVSVVMTMILRDELKGGRK